MSRGWIQEDKGQRKVTYAYDGNGDLQSVTDAAGIALEFTYGFGHPVEDDVTSLVDGEIATEHAITRVADHLGNIHSVERDLQGWRSTTAAPACSRGS